MCLMRAFRLRSCLLRSWPSWVGSVWKACESTVPSQRAHGEGLSPAAWTHVGACPEDPWKQTLSPSPQLLSNRTWKPEPVSGVCCLRRSLGGARAPSWQPWCGLYQASPRCPQPVLLCFLALLWATRASLGFPPLVPRRSHGMQGSLPRPSPPVFCFRCPRSWAECPGGSRGLVLRDSVCGLHP